MAFVGDILCVSGLAGKVYNAYKDAPDGYKHISNEVKSLEAMINKCARHFERITPSNSDWQEGQEVLKGCRDILEDLNHLIEKYKILALKKKGLAVTRLKLGLEDVATLRARLIFNTGLLNGYIQRSNIPPITTGYISC